MAKISLVQVLKQKQKLKEEKTIANRKAKAEMRFKNYLSQTAKSMLKDFPRYELRTNRHDTFVSSQIPEPTDSIWAPWSKLFTKRKK